MYHPSPMHSGPQLWQAAGLGFERLFRTAPGHEVLRQPGAMLALSGVPCPDLNCGVVWDPAVAAVAIPSLAHELRSRNLPGILLVAEGGGGEALAAAARTGLVEAGRMPLMTRGPGSISCDPRFTARRAASAADLAASNRLVAEGFEVPLVMVEQAFRPGLLDSEDTTVELVLEGDEPVGSLQTTTQGSLVGIWSMVTPPVHRRRGVALAGLAQVLEKHFAAGASLAFLISTEAGRRLYAAAGFLPAAWCSAWVATVPGPGPT